MNDPAKSARRVTSLWRAVVTVFGVGFAAAAAIAVLLALALAH